MEDWEEAKQMLEHGDVDLGKETDHANKLSATYHSLRNKTEALIEEVTRACVLAGRVYCPDFRGDWDNIKYDIGDFKVRFVESHDLRGNAGLIIKKKKSGKLLDYTFKIQDGGDIIQQRMFTFNLEKIGDLVELLSLLEKNADKIDRMIGA